jgi:hypothetical protein
MRDTATVACLVNLPVNFRSRPKARLFGDAEAAGKILPASRPGAAKARVGR